MFVHQIAEQKHESYSYLEKVKKLMHLLLSLGINVIIETSTNIYPQIDEYVMQLCRELDGEYLGELPRLKSMEKNFQLDDLSNDSKKDHTKIPLGRFYWFKSDNDKKTSRFVSQETFKDFNGIYPKKFYN